MNSTVVKKNGFSIRVGLSNNSLDLSLNILLLLVIVFVYFPVFSNQFQLEWDDQLIVINQYTSGGLSANNIWAILTQFYAGQYAPVNQLYYTLLYTVFGYDPFWFHLFSVVIHMANVLLTYSLIKRILTITGFEYKSIYRIAFATAFMMAIHPFLVEAVAWVSASKVLLYSFFYLIAIHFYISYIKVKDLHYYWLVLMFFIIAMGTKEQAVTLPICLLLIDYVVKRNFNDRKVWLEKMPLLILGIIFGVITMFSQKADDNGILTNMAKYPFYQNIIFACYALTEYLVKCLVPVKLSQIYFFPNAIGDPVPLMFWIYPLLTSVVVISFWGFWKKKWVLFGMMFFIIHLIIVINIIPMARAAIVADRYVYVASIGLFFLIAYFANKLLENIKYRNLTLITSFCYVIAIGSYAHEHSKVWHDSDSLKVELKKLIEKNVKAQRNEKN